MNSPTYKTFEPVCPACEKPLRERTQSELIADMVAHGSNPELAPFVLGARTGGLIVWWCAACEREWTPYSLLVSQAIVDNKVPAGEIWVESGGKRTVIKNVGQADE